MEADLLRPPTSCSSVAPISPSHGRRMRITGPRMPSPLSLFLCLFPSLLYLFLYLFSMSCSWLTKEDPRTALLFSSLLFSSSIPLHLLLLLLLPSSFQRHKVRQMNKNENYRTAYVLLLFTLSPFLFFFLFQFCRFNMMLISSTSCTVS